MAKIIYEDEAPGAKEATTLAIADLQPFSNPADILRENLEVPQVATLEDDYWVLGPHFKLFPDNPENLGLWSLSMSGADGTFADPPTLVLSLADQFSSVGMTITFDSFGPTWCNDLTIQWYRGAQLLSEMDFQPDAYAYTCLNQVTAFDKVIIIFRAMTAPYRFLKIQSFIYGIMRTFGPSEFFNVRLYRAASPVSDTVEISTFDLELRNQSSVAFMFQNRQALKVYDKGHLLGEFFISTYSRTGANAYSIQAVDWVGLLEAAPEHMGGIYNNVPVADLLEEIMGDIPYDLDNSYLGMSLSGWLPIAKPRDSLHQVAFAIGATVNTANTDKIRICPVGVGAPSVIYDEDKCYQGGRVETETTITQVQVAAHTWRTGTQSTELFNNALFGETTIHFTEPVHGLTISSGGTILSSNANHATISGSGNVILSGTPYNHSTSVYTMVNPYKTASDVDNPLSAMEMYLVSQSIVQDVLARLLAFALQLDTVRGKVLTGTEKLGDRASIVTAYGEARTGVIVEQDLILSNTLAGDVAVLVEET